jgi:HD superfamily phosphodiesterase
MSTELIDIGTDWEMFSSCLYKALKLSKGTVEHIKRVRVLCQRFLHVGLKVDENLLLLSAGLHDIAKKLAGEDHHKKEKIIKALQKARVREEYIKALNKAGVYEIITAHKGKFRPKKHQLEAAILRICDKLDKFDKAKGKEIPYKKAGEAMNDCNETMGKIYKDFDNKDNLDKFDGFCQVYMTVLQQQIESFNEFLEHN